MQPAQMGLGEGLLPSEENMQEILKGALVWSHSPPSPPPAVPCLLSGRCELSWCSRLVLSGTVSTAQKPPAQPAPWLANLHVARDQTGHGQTERENLERWEKRNCPVISRCGPSSSGVRQVGGFSVERLHCCLPGLYLFQR